ncbi:MAG: TetR family transcriptional regulator [Polyangiales bacterium]
MVRAKRQSWSGSPPESEAEARARLIAAALQCAEAKGLRRTTIADIAAAAGVTRPTVYTYFPDRHTIFHAAFLDATARLAVGARAAMAAKRTAGERAVEAVVYFALELPRDPCLRLTLTDDGLGEFTSQALRQDAVALGQAAAILAPMFELAPQLRPQRAEVVEVIVRFALSLLTVPSPRARTPAQLRAFLRRRLLPAIGLAEDPAALHRTSAHD